MGGRIILQKANRDSWTDNSRREADGTRKVLKNKIKKVIKLKKE